MVSRCASNLMVGCARWCSATGMALRKATRHASVCEAARLEAQTELYAALSKVEDELTGDMADTMKTVESAKAEAR